MALKLVNSRLYPGGYQYEWCALDAAGHVGVFNTAGCGPVPPAALAADADGSMGTILDTLRALKPAGAATVASGADFDAEYYEYAQRGLFPFDWSDVGQPITDLTATYVLQAVPAVPVLATDLSLPDGLAKLLASIRLRIDFRLGGPVAALNLADFAGGALVGHPE